MPLFELTLRVISENVFQIKINPEEYQWEFKVQCSKCFIEINNTISFSKGDEIENENGHSHINFQMKCKECKSLFTIDVHKSSKFHLEVPNGNDSGVFAVFECRGVNLLNFIPNSDLIIEAVDSGSEFKSDLSDLVCEYDEKNGNMIYIHEPAFWSLNKK